MTIDGTAINEWARNLTVITMFIVIIVTGARKVWVFRWVVEEQMALLTKRAEDAEARELWWRDAFWRHAELSGTTADVARALKDEVAKRS